MKFNFSLVSRIEVVYLLKKMEGRVIGRRKGGRREEGRGGGGRWGEEREGGRKEETKRGRNIGNLPPQSNFQHGSQFCPFIFHNCHSKSIHAS